MSNMLKYDYNRADVLLLHHTNQFTKRKFWLQKGDLYEEDFEYSQCFFATSCSVRYYPIISAFSNIEDGYNSWMGKKQLDWM